VVFLARIIRLTSNVLCYVPLTNAPYDQHLRQSLSSELVRVYTETKKKTVGR